METRNEVKKTEKVENKTEAKEISLKELFDVVWKGKWLIIICSAIVLLLGTVGGLVYDRMNSSVVTIVTMQWSGLNQGEYPNGTSFDYTEAIESYVVREAIIEADLDGVISTNDVVQATTITPIIPNDAAALIQQSLEAGEPLSYHATDYKIIINNGELGISVSQASKLIDKVVTEFTEDFEKKYIQQAVILDYTDADYDTLDYDDIKNVLQTQVDLVQSTIELKYEQSPEFFSESLGFGFNDILVRAELIETLEINQIESRTNTYLLSKDPDYLVTKYNYAIEKKGIEYDKLALQEAAAQNLVDTYNGSTQTILIPGMDPTQVVEIDTYYDTLLTNLITIQNDMANLEKDIDYLELLVRRLEGTEPGYEVDDNKRLAEIAIVEDAIISADTKLTSVVADGNKLLTEYNAYLTSSVIKQLMTPQYLSSISVMLVSAVSIVVGAGIGGVVVLFRHEW